MIALPDYKTQSHEVRERFQTLAARPELLRIEGLTKRFAAQAGEQTVLDGVDLSVR